MPGAKTKGLSLWRQTWREFIKSWQALWLWVLTVAVIMGAIGIGLSFVGGSIDEFLSVPVIFKLFASLINPMVYPGLFATSVLGGFLSIGINILLTYFMTALYLRYVIEKKPPMFSVGNFFHWFLRALAKWLIVFGPMIVGVAMALSLSNIMPSKDLSVMFAGLLFTVTFYFACFAIFRFEVVTPLAILQRESALKSSWALTRGNWWRIFGNFIIISLIFVILAHIAGIPVFIVAKVLRDSGSALLERGLWGLYLGLFASAAAMMFSIFSCTVCRVLLSEQKEATIPQEQTNNG